MTLERLRDMITVQVRVVWALILRETRATFGRSQIGYLWALLTPIGSLTILLLFWAMIDRRAPVGSSPALFFASGLLMLEFFRKCSNSLMNAFKANKALLYYPLIKELDVLIARILLISATYVVVILLFFSVIIVWDDLKAPPHIEQMMLAFVVMALFGFGVGSVNAVIYSLWDSWERVEAILTRPLLFISAIFYNPNYLPKPLLDVIKWNPVLQLIEWMRCGLYANYTSEVLDRSYTVFVTIILILFGLSGERLFRKQRFHS